MDQTPAHHARGVAVALAAFVTLLPSVARPLDGDVAVPPGKAALVAACERASRRVYDLCMAGPKADLRACVEEGEDAYARCMSPPETARPPEPPSDDTLSVHEYRIPYADGTKVKVTRDYFDHDPVGRFDMHGVGPGPHRIVAAREGKIVLLMDSRSRNQHPFRWLRNEERCFNNYVWIDHGDGEWTKYSHMKQYTTSGAAKLRVGDEVAAGQYLGDEGAVGCAAPGHLHFEVLKRAALKDGEDPPVPTSSGELEGLRKRPRLSNLNGTTFRDGETYLVNPAPTCKKDGDCDDGFWCNAGLDLKKSRCEPLKDDEAACDVVGGGHQCKGGKCKFGRCYTPASVAIFGTCYTDEACVTGKCSDAGGLKGMCVCKRDSDCPRTTEYCDAGLDTKLNACRPKLAEGKKCGKAGSIGNDHKCLSGKCSGFPKYVCKP